MHAFVVDLVRLPIVWQPIDRFARLHDDGSGLSQQFRQLPAGDRHGVRNAYPCNITHQDYAVNFAPQWNSLPGRSGVNPWVAIVGILVMAAHTVLIGIALKHRYAAAPLELESRTIAARLLPPEPAVTPPAIQSTPLSVPARTVPRVNSKVRTKPKSVPSPLPVAELPSPHHVETPAPAALTPTASASAAPPAPASLPADKKPTMALDVPKNVSHLDCRIVQPDYPQLSKRRGETGIAYIRFLVSLTGEIGNVELKQSSGYSRLDDAALEAMRDSTCKPYLENGHAVRATYTQPFEFSLHD